MGKARPRNKKPAAAPPGAAADADLRVVPLDRLDPHPNNPRLAFREDVVEGIRASLNGHMSPEHALRVRPVGDRFQIVAGHQRHEAARRAGLAAVPCWVREMTDADAHMALVLDNRHGELGPLEIGLHALETVGRGKAGRGNKGGLSQYARELGKSRQYIDQLVAAAEVAKSASQLADLSALADKTQHLNAVHPLPQSLWPGMVAALLEHDWSVKDTEAAAGRAAEFLADYTPPAGWETYLPADPLALEVAAGRLKPPDVARLGETAAEVADKLAAGLAAYRESVAGLDESVRPAVPDLVARWVGWLVGNAGKASWNLREVRRVRDELEDELAALSAVRPAAEYRLITGDFRTADIPDGSIDFIVTDPPYEREAVPLYRDLSRFAARVLKPGGSLLCMTGEFFLTETLPLLCDALSYHWLLAYLTPGGQAVQYWERNLNSFWKPVVWLTKGEYAGPWVGDVCRSAVNDNDKGHHHWGQSESGMADLLERFTRPGERVCDPFAGGGTTGVVAVRLGRVFVGVEIDPATAKAADARIAAAASEASQDGD